ncbi:MAG: CoA-binding protein, partial [Dehalococcoidia bacterium]|nr:CoA-binding protein [Dehalococcoidia bacterium]
KSDVGGVALGLQNAAAVRRARREMLARVAAAAPQARIEGVSVQQMAAAGTEVIIGATTDPQFGPVMMFGLGGVFVEVLKDVAFRIVPLEPRDAAQIVREIRGLPILQGVRGQPAADLPALERLVLAVSRFVAAHPEVAELDLNPVFAYPQGAVAVDARIVLAEV